MLIFNKKTSHEATRCYPGYFTCGCKVRCDSCAESRPDARMYLTKSDDDMDGNGDIADNGGGGVMAVLV